MRIEGPLPVGLNLGDAKIGAGAAAKDKSGEMLSYNAIAGDERRAASLEAII